MIRVVGAVLNDKHYVILAKISHNAKKFPNLFEFPGGKIENNETSQEALIRELNEELNIIVNKKDIYAFKGNQYSHAIEKSGEVIHLTLFIVKKWQGSIQIKENIHDEVAYIEIAHLHTFKGLIPGDETYISGIQNYFAIN